MRTILTFITTVVASTTIAPVVWVAGMLRIKHRRGSIYERGMNAWARSVLGAAGVKLRVHGIENVPEVGAVHISNHVSWFDVFAIAAVLPRCTFIAKRELRRVPIFGSGAAAAGIVFIDRDNRKSAFESYREATMAVQSGRSVVVCPEGTRGLDYPLRPFKKGPFVLAIAAQAPVVPTVVYGAREVMRKGSFRIRSGVVDVHFLPPVSTEGLGYEDRAKLVTDVWHRMADALEREHGVVSAGREVAAEGERAQTA